MTESIEPNPYYQTEQDDEKHTKSRGERFKERAKHGVDSVGAGVREKGTVLVNQGRTRAAHKVRELRASTEKAAMELESNGSPAAASATRAVAGIANNVASYLDEKEVEQIWQDASGYTKKHPVLVIGGLFLAGAAIGRFLRSSAEHQPTASGPYAKPGNSAPGTGTEEPGGVIGYSEKGDLPNVTPQHVGPAATDS